MMKDPIYIWEITIPMKIEWKLWAACILCGIDICQEYCDVNIASFCDYEVLQKANYHEYFADVLICCSDEKEKELYHKLIELDVYAVDMWLLDSFDDMEEDILWSKK